MKTINKLGRGQRVAYLDEQTGVRKCGAYLGMICGNILVRRLNRTTKREWWTHELIDRQQLIPRTGSQYAKIVGYLQGRLNSRYIESHARLEQMVLREMLAMDCMREGEDFYEWRVDLHDAANAGFRIALSARVRSK